MRQAGVARPDLEALQIQGPNRPEITIRSAAWNERALRFVSAAPGDRYGASGEQTLGRSLISLPASERAKRYREFAAAAVHKATKTTDHAARAEYLSMASSWHAMAVELERAPHLAGFQPEPDAQTADQPQREPRP